MHAGNKVLREPDCCFASGTFHLGPAELTFLASADFFQIKLIIEKRGVSMSSSLQFEMSPVRTAGSIDPPHSETGVRLLVCQRGNKHGPKCQSTASGSESRVFCVWYRTYGF